MRKRYFIVVIVFMLLFNINVNAETYYGNYYLIENNKNFKEDEGYVVERRLYNTYTLEYVDMGYLEENDLYIKDELDYIDEYVISDNYTDTSDEYILLPYKKDYISIYDIFNLKKGTAINEVEIYNNDEKIIYDTLINNISYVKYINDNNFDTYTISNNNGSYVRLNLINNYKREDLKFIFYTDNNIECTISINNTENLDIKLTGKKHIITLSNEIDNVNYSYGNTIRKYRYKKEEKVLNNNYVEDTDNIILDDYITEYTYYKRDKLVLEDNIILNNVNTNLDSFIQYSTDEVITTCNIDYNINGEYYCNFKLNDISVDKKVIVNIENNIIEDNIVKEDVLLDNDIKLEENIIKDDNVIKNNEVNNIIEESKNAKKKIIEKTDEIYIDKVINEEIKDETTNLEINNTLDKETNSEIKKVNKSELSNSVKNKYLVFIKYVIIVLIILIEILLSIRKKKIKSNVENI